MTWALESLKHFHFNRLLLSKVYILLEVKKYRRVIFYENEEGCKLWRGIDLLFQNWHKEFDKFWPQHSKVSNIFTLIGSFWAKYILFELKKYRGVIHETEEGYKIWRGIDFSFQNWHKGFDKFWPEHSQVSKLKLWWDLFAQSRKCMTLKLTEELCFMTIKRNWLFILRLTWGISQILTRALESLKICVLIGYL